MTSDDHTGMPNAPAATEAANGVRERFLTFSYRGWLLTCGTQRIDGRTFRPVAFCRSAGAGGLDSQLPSDTDNVAYGSEAEALRHAEQQAIRWVHDRTGGGQGEL